MILAYTYPHGVAQELAVLTYPAAKFEKLGVSGRIPMWLPGAKPRFLFLRDSACYLYDWETRREKLLFSVAPNRIYDMQPSPDGRRIWFTQTIRDADVWMGENK